MVSVFLDSLGDMNALFIRYYSTVSYYMSSRNAIFDRRRALQQLPRFDLLGADTVSEGMPLCHPTGSSRNELGTVVEHASLTFEAMFGNGMGEAAVAMSPS